MGTMILTGVCCVLLGLVILAFLGGIGYAGVMLASICVWELGGETIVGKIFAAIFGFIGGLLCPFWWAVCLAALN